MAPLPGIEIPPAASFTHSGTVQLNAGGSPAVENRVEIGLHGALGPGQEWRLFRTLTDLNPGGPSDWRAQLWLRSPSLSGDVELEQIIHGSAIDDTVYFTPVSFAATVGPYRLNGEMGVSGHAQVVGGPLNLAEYQALVYTWYEDEATHFDETFATESANIFQIISLAQVFGDVAQLVIHAFGSIDTAGEEVARFTNVQVDGTDLPVAGMTLFDAHLVEVAAGDFNVIGTVADPADVEFRAAPGGTLTYDVEVRDFAGSVIAAPEAVDDWLTTVELHNAVQKTPFEATLPLTPTAYSIPVQTSYSRPTRDLPNGFAIAGSPHHSVLLEMRPSWLTSQGWDPEDLPIILDQPSPLSGVPTYSPLALFHKGAVEVDRPDGGRPSSWAINDGANGSVTEGANSTTFVVTNVAARFTRAFQENWRNYIDRFQPDFRIDGYSILKHNFLADASEPQQVYPEDIWWWNSYEFLRLTVNASAPATLTLQVDGIDLEVDDTHNSNPAFRELELGFTHHQEMRKYSVAVAAGTADYWLDLSFPMSFSSESGALFPMRRPRVDQLTLSFSATGTFIVSRMELSRRDSYANQTLAAFPGVNSHPAEWPGLYTRVDGSPVAALTVPDETRKGQESDPGAGGAIRFAEPSTVLLLTAEEMVEDYQRVEGFSISYSDAARAAFHRDAVGTDLVTRFTEPAQFLVEVTPGGNWSGAGDAHTFVPSLALRVGALLFVNGIDVTFKGRKRLGGGVESVACVNGARAGAGLSYDIVDQAMATLGTVVSDARGRIHFEPIRHGKIVSFEVA